MKGIILAVICTATMAIHLGVRMDDVDMDDGTNNVIVGYHGSTAKNLEGVGKLDAELCGKRTGAQAGSGFYAALKYDVAKDYTIGYSLKSQDEAYNTQQVKIMIDEQRYERDWCGDDDHNGFTLKYDLTHDDLDDGFQKVCAKGGRVCQCLTKRLNTVLEEIDGVVYEVSLLMPESDVKIKPCTPETCDKKVAHDDSILYFQDIHKKGEPITKDNIEQKEIEIILPTNLFGKVQLKKINDKGNDGDLKLIKQMMLGGEVSPRSGSTTASSGGPSPREAAADNV